MARRSKTARISAAIALLCALCSAQGGPSNPAADRDSDIATLLLSLERSKFRAVTQGDTGVLNAIFDDALMFVDSDGQLSTKAGYLESQHDARGNPLRAAPESMAVKIFGRLAIVVGIYNESGMRSGHAFHRRCRFIDTWQFKNGKWVCIAATATSAIA